MNLKTYLDEFCKLACGFEMVKKCMGAEAYSKCWNINVLSWVKALWHTDEYESLQPVAEPP